MKYVRPFLSWFLGELLLVKRDVPQPQVVFTVPAALLPFAVLFLFH